MTIDCHVCWQHYTIKLEARKFTYFLKLHELSNRNINCCGTQSKHLLMLSSWYATARPRIIFILSSYKQK
jgi:hypothetical protein